MEIIFLVVYLIRTIYLELFSPTSYLTSEVENEQLPS